MYKAPPSRTITEEMEKKAMVKAQEDGFQQLLESNPELNAVKIQLDNVIGDLDQKLSN